MQPKDPADVDLKTPECRESRLQKIKASVQSRYPDTDAAEIVDRAFRFSSECHEGQKRHSGEDYIEHPLAVAETLAKWEAAPELIVAALLHDVLEDVTAPREGQDVPVGECAADNAQAQSDNTQKATDEARKRLKKRIVEEFGSDVGEIVEGLTKMDRMVFESREERTRENLRRFFAAVGRDLRVVPIKLADRLHNMRTLSSIKEEWKQKRTAKETLKLYAPLAYRCGMGEVQSELEDLAFEYFLPEIYRKLASRLKDTKEHRLAALESAKEALTQRLSEADISARIVTRSKNYYSIYRKMVRQGLAVDEVLDIVGMRVVTNTERDCYRVLGEVQLLWLPLPGTFKDYIATPKPNMYKSLHTVVMIDAGYQMEVQIRTERMDLMAERGIAAHWRYKEAADRSVLNKLYKESDVSQWVNEFITGYIEKDKGTRLLDDIKTMLQAEDIYAMTPRGEMRIFPQGATLIDFAYNIHTSVGHMFMSGKVAGVHKPPDYQLKTGDMVEIITDKSATPKKEWLKFVKTPYARHAIQKWFKIENRRKMADVGQRVLEEKLNMAQVPHSEFYKSPQLASFIHRSGLSDLNDLFVKISAGKIELVEALRAVLPKNGFEKVHTLTVSQTPPEAEFLEEVRSHGRTLVISGAGSPDVILAKCCHPLPGDDVVGYVKRGRGVTIHRVECEQVEPFLPDSIRLIRDIEWDVGENATFDAVLDLRSTNRRGILVDITKALLKANIDIRQLRSDRLPEETVAFRMDLLVTSAEQLDQVIDVLKDIEGVTSAERK